MRTGRDPSKLEQQTHHGNEKDFWFISKKNRIGKQFFKIISKLNGQISFALHGPMAGGSPDLVPWAACLGKFAFWSWGCLKLYIRVFDSFVVTSLWCRICLSVNSGVRFFSGGVRQMASHVGQNEGVLSVKVR
jgi:hypothetical protein